MVTAMRSDLYQDRSISFHANLINCWIETRKIDRVMLLLQNVLVFAVIFKMSCVMLLFMRMTPCKKNVSDLWTRSLYSCWQTACLVNGQRSPIGCSIYQFRCHYYIINMVGCSFVKTEYYFGYTVTLL